MRSLAKKLAILILFLLVPALCFAQQKVTFGKYNSRALFTKSKSIKCSAPLVILVPGSGANGPESMMPGSLTATGKDHSIFSDFTKGLLRAGVGTLAIGKPGVDFFKSWKTLYYDKILYTNLVWQDLIENLKEAVLFAKKLPCVDPNRIVVLGHSEGSQVAVDFATQNSEMIKSLILVGYAGESLASTIDWQLFRRAIDAWLIPDVDLNSDGFVSKAEAAFWPEFIWEWGVNQEKVSFGEIEKALRQDSQLQKEYQRLTSSKIWNGIIDREPIYYLTARLKQDLFVFSGSFDVQTHPEDVTKLEKVCIALKKKNCIAKVLPELGHAMSQPKGPRKQRYLDSTLGPVDKSFLKVLEQTAKKL